MKNKNAKVKVSEKNPRLHVSIDYGHARLPEETYQDAFRLMAELDAILVLPASRETVARRAEAHGLATTTGGRHVALYANNVARERGERFAIVTGNFGEWL